jgi:hypothetical protein
MIVIQPIRKLIALLTIALVLSGCTSYLSADQPAGVDLIEIQEGKVFGQSFVATHQGLEGVQFFLKPGESRQGRLFFHLRSSPEAVEDLASAEIPLHEIDQEGFYNFNFPHLTDSQHKYYYASIEMEGQGRLGIQVGPPESYLNGAAYQDGHPLEAQGKFRLAYHGPSFIWGVLSDAIAWGGIVLVGFVLFVLPGSALTDLVFNQNSKVTWVEKFSLGAGVSLAAYPLLLLWMDLSGVQAGAAFAWLPAGLGLIWLVWRGARWFRALQTSKNGRWQIPDFASREGFPWACVALTIVVILLVLTRFWAIRTVEAPMWGDSVQHAVIAQLVLDNGGLFNSWEPYAPYNSLTVQFGFPAAAAVFAWLSGVSSWQATLYTGQLVNILAVVALFPLVVRLSGNQWAGVAAVFIAGLISPMPAMYVNWGRYAQLMGQAILPAALWLLWTSLEHPKQPGQGRQRLVKALPVLILAGFGLAGMSLSYYRMPFFYATFTLALLAGWGLPKWKASLLSWGWGAVKLAIIGVSAGLFCLPWVWRVMQGSVLAGLVQSGVETSATWQNLLLDYQVWRNLNEYIPLTLQILAILGLVYSLVRRKFMVAAIGLWIAGLASLVALSLLRVPGTNLVQNFAIVISLYIPVSLICGWLVGELTGTHLFQTRLEKVLITAVLTGAAFWFAIAQRNLAQPDTFALVTRPDMQAMVWIRDNTPTDSLFLVEGFGIYGYSAVGSDAGWWLPLLAGRRNTIPPQYALMNEAPIDPHYSQNVAQLVGQLEQAQVSAIESMEALCKWGITHVYIGQRQGKASLDGLQLFNPEEFDQNPDFIQVYRKDRVHIYALEQGACENYDG